MAGPRATVVSVVISQHTSPDFFFLSIHFSGSVINHCHPKTICFLSLENKLLCDNFPFYLRVSPVLFS